MDFLDHKGLECTAPCDMYSVLYSHKIIDDPYYGTNEQELRYLCRNGCTFYTTFKLSKEELAREKIDLNFYGIDTICDIYVNGTLLDSVMNMHRMYSYDIKPLAKEENEIVLEISSPIEYFDKMEAAHHLYTNWDTLSGAAHLRKALFMSGWDWGPTLPNMGIFRDVEVRAYDTDVIDDFEIMQNHENGKVKLLVKASTKHGAQGVCLVCSVDGQKIELENGEGEITVDNPRLWWPNGLGEQNLYDVELCLYKGESLLDRTVKSVGLRTLVLSQEDDADGGGQEFCFKVNGIKIFAMGANYVPVDTLPSRITNERLERLVQDCIFANFNCVRVWGGAFYPRDYFYELCDKYGLIVWQDFMVACSNVWMRPEFEYEFTQEAIYNVKRIRHHASLGILCGNNEMEEAICNWPCADGNDPLVRQDYLKLYEEILPSVCKEYAPYISYTPSSPTSGGNFEEPTAYNRGDVHFWHVWNGNCGFDEYRKHKFRFCSEYGFESLPSIKTIDAFCPEDEKNLLSFTMEGHQKHVGGNVKLLKYLAEQYKMPKNLEMTVYGTQLNQANAIKYGVEHFRRCRPYTMGSVYWQLNDSWPVASWSSIDYFGRYKALHYFAKKFYQPVSLGLFNENGSVCINVSNETLNTFEGYIKYGVKRSDLTPVFEGEKKISVGALTSLDVESVPNSDFDSTRDFFFWCELYNEQGELLARNTELGTVPKHFKFQDPQIKAKVTKNGDTACIELTGVAFAKNVQISFKNHDIALSDNYFDLTSNEPYRVYASTELSASELEKDISAVCVYHMS